MNRRPDCGYGPNRSIIFSVLIGPGPVQSRSSASPRTEPENTKCGGVGHYHHDCPTHDSDAANIAVTDDDHDEEQALTAIADEIKEAW